MKDLLKCLFTNSGEAADDTIIAHCVPTTSQRDQDTSGRPTSPRNILVRFLRFTDSEKVRHRGRQHGKFKWKDARVDW